MHLEPTHVAGAALFFDYAVVGAMRTTLAFASRSLGGGPLLLALLESGFGMGQVGGALAVGRLSDMHGRRALLMACLCCSAVAYALAGSALQAGSVALLLLSRLPAGVSKQTTTTARAIVCDSTSPHERAGALSVLYACCALGYAVGPLVGGALTTEDGGGPPSLLGSAAGSVVSLDDEECALSASSASSARMARVRARVVGAASPFACRLFTSWTKVVSAKSTKAFAAVSWSIAFPARVRAIWRGFLRSASHSP